MNRRRQIHSTEPRALLLFIVTTAAILLISSCGARDRTTDAGQPRATEMPAPILLLIPATREAAVRTAWQTLLREQGITANESLAPLNLSPVTKTITMLPSLPANLRLPRVGDPAATGGQRTADERESLRRFINANNTLTGVTGDTLTLIETNDLTNNTRRALYEQRPFIYPLRGGYGRVIIDYTTDNRVLNLTSTALPEAGAADERLRTLSARLTADEARATLVGKVVEVKSGGGSSTQRTLSGDAENLRKLARATELVVYPIPAAGEGDEASIVLHLAWELSVEDAGGRYFVYVNAISGEILGASFNTDTGRLTN